MPYKNIVFAKLEKRLLDDHRWYMMSEDAQLIYIKLILLASATYNKVPKNPDALRIGLKTTQDLETLKKSIAEIKANFPKFKEAKGFYFFDKFEEKTNYIPKQAIPRKAQGSARVGVDKSRVDKSRVYKNREEKTGPSAALKAALDSVYKKGFNIYELINRVKKELRWQPGRYFPEEVLLGVCEEYNKYDGKIEKPWPWFVKVLELKSNEYYAQQQVTKHQEVKSMGAVSLKDILKGVGK